MAKKRQIIDKRSSSYKPAGQVDKELSTLVDTAFDKAHKMLRKGKK